MAVECWSRWPWLSPAAAWFVFFNAVVAAAVVMSWGQGGHALSPRRRLCRSASSVVLDRLRSFSIFSVHPADGAGVSDSDYCCWREAEEAVPAPQFTQVCTQAPETPTPTPGVAGQESETAAGTALPIAAAAKALAEDHAASASASERAEHGADAEEEQDTSISMDEAYALAQQRRPQQPPSRPASAAGEATTAAARQKKGELAKATKRRRSRARGRGAEEALKGKAELNARAELFIRQFREELKLQRLNSILSHTPTPTPTAAR